MGWDQYTIYQLIVCVIGEYGVVSVHTCGHPDHCDVLNTPDSK